MKPYGSSLNPFAESYIPLSKREADRNYPAKNSSEKSIGADFSGYSEQYIQNPPYDNNSSPNLNTHHGEKAPIAVASAVKDHPFHGSLSQLNSDLAEMIGMFDREFDIDLEYLQATYPGLSYQSLSDVYYANRGDLGAAIDMLSQLEPSYAVDPESLPDTLDIGDISESAFAADLPPPFKTKNVAGDASTSFRS